MDHRFFLAQRVYNCMVKEATRRFNFYCLNPQVKAIWKRNRKKSYELTKEDKAILKEAREANGLEENAFHAYLTKQNAQYPQLDANTIQKIGTTVWQGMSSVLFGKGRKLHFKRYEDLFSVEGKDNRCGITFRSLDVDGHSDRRMHWKGLNIPVRVRTRDMYAIEALTHRIKYCRIIRIWYKHRYRYYLELILEGNPPPKRNRQDGSLRHHPAQAVAGVDPGTSVLAAASIVGVALKEYGEEVERIDERIAALQEKMDRSRRANNPQNYMPDGQIRRMKRGEKRVWNNSKTYIRTRSELRHLHRVRAAKLKQAHYITANQIVDEVGCNLVIEKMNFAALAKRSRKNKINAETGLPNSKKRFGNSIRLHGPGQQITLLKWRALQAGGTVLEVDPRTAKGSQYNPFTDTYEKVGLDVRWKELIPGIWAQRDLLTGYLYSCYDQEKQCFDREKCLHDFPKFYALQIMLIYRLIKRKEAGLKTPSCMGLDDLPAPILNAITFD